MVVNWDLIFMFSYHCPPSFEDGEMIKEDCADDDGMGVCGNGRGFWLITEEACDCKLGLNIYVPAPLSYGHS